MVLKQKTKDNYGKKPNPNDVTTHTGPNYVGSGYDVQGRDYSPAWGGQFENGGEIPMAQSGRATRADSLDVYNRALKIDAYYQNLKNKGWYTSVKNTSTKSPSFNSKSLEKEMKEIDKASIHTYKKQIEEDPFWSFLKWTYPNVDVKAVNKKALNEHIKLTKGTKYASKDNYPMIIDPMAPTTVIDTRILPKERVEYRTNSKSVAEGRTPPGGTQTALYRYPPLSVMPWDMFKNDPKLIAERIKKYGTEGIPESYLNKNKTDSSKTTPVVEKEEAVPIQSVTPHQIIQTDMEIGNPNFKIPVPGRIPKSYDVDFQANSIPGSRIEYYDKHEGVEQMSPEELGKMYKLQQWMNNEYDKRYRYDNLRERFPNHSQEWIDKQTEKLKAQRAALDVKLTATPHYQMGGSIPGAVGFSYARTQSPAPSKGPKRNQVDITDASAQNGEEMRYYQNGLDWRPKSISQNGGWLDEYDVAQNGVETWKKQQALVKKEKLEKLTELLKNPPVFKNKTFEEKVKENLKENPKTVVKENTAVRNYNNADKFSKAARNKTDKEIADERKAIRKKSDENVLNQWSTEILDRDNWTRQNLSDAALGLESNLRVSDEPNFFDDYLNPANMIGNMASNLGQAPLQAEQTDSYMPYVTSIGTPLAVGALAGLGANSNAQFVNNLTNPVAGLNVGPRLNNYLMSNNFTNELLSHARSLGPNSNRSLFNQNRQMINNSFGNEEVGDLIQRLRNNQPLEESQLTSLGQAYNSGYLTRNESDLFTRHLIDRNRVVPSPPGGLFGMTAEETAAARARMEENPFGWGTERWNANQLPPPPSEIRFNVDGSTESIYSARPQYTSPVPGPGGIDLRRPINGHAPGTPEWERLNNQIWESQNMMKPTIRNKSGYTKEDLLSQASSKDKDVISKMTEKEFQETVFTPKGEVLNFKPGTEIDQMVYNPTTGGSVLKDQIPLSNEEYAKVFNENIDVLNDIISKNNKSGVNYTVSELTPSGQLMFNSPTGQSTWNVNIKPGQWRGEVENIANPEYYKSIPGLDMSNTGRSVFADNTARRGTGTYESINEYLKRFDLGRVKPGFNSQTQFSRGLWENAIKKDKAFGFYGNPGTVYGSMKSIAPYIGVGGIGAAAASQTEEEVPQQKGGGVIKDDMGYWNPENWDSPVEIGSNEITMKYVPFDVLGISDEGDVQHMKSNNPKNYKFKGKKVTEFRMAKNGLRQEQKGLVNLDQLTNFTNYNTKQPGGWLDQY
jgi:hypothetical protein